MTEDDELTGEHQPHDTRIVVWDVPATVECGETFKVTVGVKCASGCRPDGWTVEVRDHDGSTLASAATSSEPWPDTAGLHHARLELSAPDTEGIHAWEARVPVDGLDVPHAAGVARFRVRAVPAPESHSAWRGGTVGRREA